ncbi:MAG: hypothetical protein ABL998_20615 [Planctomycetota bacterium]
MTLLVIGSLAGVLISVSYRHKGEIRGSVSANRALLAAQAGANEVLAEFTGVEFALGSAEEPRDCAGAAWWAEVEDAGDGNFVVRSHGLFDRTERVLEVELQQLEGGPFFHGVFAGNSSGDPAYVLKLNGTGGQKDEIDGSVYSGGDLLVAEDAEVTGTLQASGTVTGGDLDQQAAGKREPIPDLAGMHYEATAGVKVADEFTAATYLADDLGGSAWQLPEESPAHIFRKNPSDRLDGTSATAKDDYYLEDPYEPIRLDSGWDGSDATQLSLSGTEGAPGPSSNHQVFFVDGNLWLHNKHTYSFQFGSGGAGGLGVTFVVKGNIYFADNLFYDDDNRDGVAFIALKDKDVADSGNIYFGDPTYGTLREMHAFMYAENNFYDTNLNTDSSSTVELVGNMTAGNQVLIQRDYTKTTRRGTTTTHTKLKIEFDERIANGDIALPGIPGIGASGEGGLTIVSWREVGS